MQYDCQVAVLGAGPGGYEAAIRCAQYGCKTVLIEEREVGGTCLNRGCIPTKALLHGAEIARETKSFAKLGILSDSVTIDYAALAAWKDRQVSRLRRGVEALERANGVQVIRGRGTLAGAHEIAVGEDRVRFDSLILATGSEPARPPIPGIENAVTSDEVLAQTSLPTDAVIIGGGVIGLEFATLYAELGCPVTVLEMLPEILPAWDRDAIAVVLDALRARECDIQTGARVTRIEKDRVFYEKAGAQCSAQGSQIVVCIGRRPRTAQIGLEAAGIRTDRGFIPVDDTCRTNVDHIYAIGDITGKVQLAHVASAQGLVAAANCAGKRATMRYDQIPGCLYTMPEVASIGLTEAEAKKAGRIVRVGSFPVSGNGRCLVMGEQQGMTKLVTDARTGEILGCQIAGPRATDLIAEIAAVMRCEGTVEELALAIHPHPTVSEMLMEAAHDVEGLSCHVMPRKRA